jgi:hypothetical protein
MSSGQGKQDASWEALCRTWPEGEEFTPRRRAQLERVATSLLETLRDPALHELAIAARLFLSEAWTDMGVPAASSEDGFRLALRRWNDARSPDRCVGLWVAPFADGDRIH